MPRMRTSFDRHLNAVVLLLAAIASLVSLGFIFMEGVWSGVSTMGILLIIILAATISSGRR